MKDKFKYIKKPVEIEAFQMVSREWWIKCMSGVENKDELPDWFKAALITGWAVSVFDKPEGKGCEKFWGIIKTLEGDHNVTWGDYIIRGVKGELYPCKPNIFHITNRKKREGEDEEKAAMLKIIKEFVKCDGIKYDDPLGLSDIEIDDKQKTKKET